MTCKITKNSNYLLAGSITTRSNTFTAPDETKFGDTLAPPKELPTYLPHATQRIPNSRSCFRILEKWPKLPALLFQWRKYTV